MQPRNPSNPQGIDVSHYQDPINWQQVKNAGNSFVFIKATEGTGMVDTAFSDHLFSAHDAGFAVGAYHYFHAQNVTEAVAEADAFIQAIEQEGGFHLLHLPPVLDVEDKNLPMEGMADICRAWLERVEQVSGRRPIVYSHPYFITNWLQAGLSDYLLWLANYDVNQPMDYGGWSNWTFLQYTQEGTVPGINRSVDRNEFSGSVEELFGYKMTPEDANKIISLLSGAYGSTEDEEAKAEFHRLADELRKASGQPVE